jgi:hypothetical protein
MFNSPVLDLVILLSFTYFVGSLLLSAINEFIVATFRYRQRHLQYALERLFFDKSWQTFVKDVMVKSPHLESLFRKQDKYPAYIPAKNFAYAIIESIGAQNFTVEGMKTLSTTIQNNKNLPAPLKTVLQNILAKTNSSVEDFKKEIEDFYNEAMDRAGGWYKKEVKRIMMVVALIFSVALNLDTIKISNDALKDKKQLSKIADNISEQVSRISMDSTQNVTIVDPEGNVLVNVSRRDSLVSDSLNKSMQNMKNLKIIYEQNTGYQLGYAGNFKEFCKEWKENCWTKIIGILLTVFALQLSANFWFDLLNKVVNLRASGKKPNHKK